MRLFACVLPHVHNQHVMGLERLLLARAFAPFADVLVLRPLVLFLHVLKTGSFGQQDHPKIH